MTPGKHFKSWRRALLVRSRPPPSTQSMQYPREQINMNPENVHLRFKQIRMRNLVYSFENMGMVEGIVMNVIFPLLGLMQ